MSRHKNTIRLLVLSILVTAGSSAQTPAKQVPPRIVYWQMFQHVNFLEQQATASVQQGKDGSSLVWTGQIGNTLIQAHR